jgi:hypothetical protein
VKKEAHEGINARADEKLCWLAYGDKNMDISNKLATVCPLHQRFRFHFMTPYRAENEMSNTIVAVIGEK